MLAAELTIPGKEIVQQGVEAGFLFNCTQEQVLRFLPPLVIQQQHVDQLIEALAVDFDFRLKHGKEGGARMTPVDHYGKTRTTQCPGFSRGPESYRQ